LPGIDVAIDPLTTEPIYETVVEPTGATGRCRPCGS
jgi:hypothetical protein